VFALFGKPNSEASLGGLVMLGGALPIIVLSLKLAKGLGLGGGGWVLMVLMAVGGKEMLFLGVRFVLNGDQV
jgi:hypothetical protein